jgi:hypothetical protein
MKKNILIFCAVLIAFGFTYYKVESKFTTSKEEARGSQSIDWNNTIPSLKNNFFRELTDQELVYKVESRFKTTITKENLAKAQSIVDILPAHATELIETYYYTRVSILDNSEETDQSETNNSALLNDAQMKLLKTADYSTDIYIRSDYKLKYGDSYLTYFITIIPEKEAEYSDGHTALIDYLKVNSKDKTAIIKRDKLQPGKVRFTVTKEGSISNVKMISTSGYVSVDETLVELIKTIPGKWNPATNAKGEKVDQELIFLFGLEGC